MGTQPPPTRSIVLGPAVGFFLVFLPTTTVAVTRAEDNLTLAIADWFNPAEGTIFVEVEWSYGSNLNPGNRVALQIDDGTNTNRILIGNHGGDRGQCRVTSGGVLEASIAGGAAGPQRTCIAFAWRSSDFALCIDGGAVTNLTTGAIPAGLTTMRVGGGIAATERLDGPVRWWYYPKRLTDAALMALTAGFGAASGTELVTNGDFSSGTTGWSASNAVLTNASNQLVITASAASPVAGTSFATVPGQAYLLVATFVTDMMTGNAFLVAGTALGGSTNLFFNMGSTVGTYTACFMATATTTWVSVSGSSSALATETMRVDNISVKAVVAA